MTCATGQLSSELAVTKVNGMRIEQRRDEVVNELGEVEIQRLLWLRFWISQIMGKTMCQHIHPDKTRSKRCAQDLLYGRLTQFFLFEPEKIFPEGKTEKEQKQIDQQKQKAEDSRLARYQNAVLDALRQMAYMMEAQRATMHGI